MNDPFRKKTWNPWTMYHNYITDAIYEKAKPVGDNDNSATGVAGTSEQWSSYNQRAKEKCPNLVRIDNIMDSVEFFFGRWQRRLWGDPMSFIRLTFKTRTWMVKPKGLKIGQWYDTDTRMLHVNMEMLRFFIEEDNHNYENEKGDFEPWEVKEFRKKEAGEPSQFDGEQGLATHQYEAMRDAWEIYLWWKDYPNREKEIENRYNEIPKQEIDRNNILGSFTKERREITKPYYEKIWELEKKLTQEEEDNLIKLMKIRSSLWS